MSRLSPLPLVLLLLGALVVVVPACGKRGPPLAPLRPAPDRPTDVSVVRRADDVTIRFSTPTHNADKSEPVVFDRIEIYAMTVQPGALPPTLKQLLAPANRLGEFGRPAAPAKRADAANASADPAADAPPVAVPLTFTEKVAIAPPSKLIPPLAAFAEGVAPQGTLPPMMATPGTTAVAAVAAPLRLQVATRYYMLVPYANRKRIGTVSEWLIVPLGSVPVAPRDAVMKYDEETLTLSWAEGARGQTFRVYDASPATATADPASSATKPLTPAPLSVMQFKQPVVFGQLRCWAVRSVRAAGPVSFESAPTPPVCVTPVDTFPPPAPSGLTAFVAEGSISLTWDGVQAADLAGYIVLRGEGTSDRLQPLMTAPVMGTSFTDTTTRAGVKYVYAVVAVDNATPANRSKESSRVEETGR